jgi:hypothetical protein
MFFFFGSFTLRYGSIAGGALVYCDVQTVHQMYIRHYKIKIKSSILLNLRLARFYPFNWVPVPYVAYIKNVNVKI